MRQFNLQPNAPVQTIETFRSSEIGKSLMVTDVELVDTQWGKKVMFHTAEGRLSVKISPKCTFNTDDILTEVFNKFPIYVGVSKFDQKETYTYAPVGTFKSIKKVAFADLLANSSVKFDEVGG